MRYSSTSLPGASDSITDFSVLSNPVFAQNILCLGLCDSEGHESYIIEIMVYNSWLKTISFE